MLPLKDDNPTRTIPFVTIIIITINTLVYAFETLLSPAGFEVFILKAAAIPYEITNLVDIGPENFIPPPFTLITAMFVHGGFFHLFGNMLFIWIFGDNIEDSLGHLKFIAFYLFTGLAASIAHVALDISSTVPMVGASGAVAGILGAYFLLFPRAKVLTLVIFFFMVRIVKIPAMVFLGLWFLFQFVSLGSAGVAWFAHIGGFASGASIILLRRLFR